ncbi:FUSC family protein [Consotaella salsifontis]|uniref:Uncharacterized membrane protein YccC n=1 Tax=Consotaella salsifontis TaxID=1365950 RepID=A0A1T4T991_9HYPH|nr:FUSC family protein [Consotaella salsifontis]SKA36943.1 Uncharacterized membrane protein YccC [Consotaella salsifontis]
MSARSIVTVDTVLFSLKTFCAAMLAYFIAIRFDLPRPFWAVATVYIVAHPLSGAIASKATYRLLGTIIGGIATLVLIPNLVNEPILLSAAIVAWVSACTFISLLDRTPRSYVFLLAGYTVLLAGLPLVTAPANTFDTVVSRVEEIGLAIVCASLVSHIVFPVHVGSILVSRIDAWMVRARALLAATTAGDAGQATALQERQALAADAADLRAFTTHLRYDGSRYRSTVGLLWSLQHRMVTFLPILSELEDLRHALARLDTVRSRRALCLMEEAGASIRAGAPNTALRFRKEIDALAPFDAPVSWEEALLANTAKNLREITKLFDACVALRQGVEKGRVPKRLRSLVSRDQTPAPHRDFGMAALSAATVAICLSSSILFWIATGWTEGMTLAQISGVLCCLLATMDDPVPAMRKFLEVTLWVIVAAFAYGFAVLPMIDGFVPLAAALGLFLIPAGICLAVPSLASVGMGLCINFPLLLTLQARSEMNFLTFANTGIATLLGMAWAIVICSLFRSVRAETNVRRLLAVVHEQVAAMAGGRHSDAIAAHHRVIDLAGLVAPRLGKVSEASDAAKADPLRDLRTGLHLMSLQDLSGDLPAPLRARIDSLLEAVEGRYLAGPNERGASVDPILAVLDHLPSAVSGTVSRVPGELLVNLAALRLSLSPASTPSTLGRGNSRTGVAA